MENMHYVKSNICLYCVGYVSHNARGNKEGINAQFTPPREQLAYKIQLPGEANFSTIFAEPLPIVIEALNKYSMWDEIRDHLPDVAPNLVKSYGLE